VPQVADVRVWEPNNGWDLSGVKNNWLKRIRKSKLNQTGEYIVFQALSLALAWVPLRLHEPLSHFVAWGWDRFFPVRRDVILENIAIAFPEKDATWQSGIAVACVRHFVRMSLECAREIWRPLEDFLRLVESTDGGEIFQQLGDGSRSIICIGGHFGNWELVVAYGLQLAQIPGYAFTKPLHNPLVDVVVTNMRQRGGVKVITTREDARIAMRVLRKNVAMGFLADQDARHSGIFVPFFKRPASTFTGPAVFAYHFNCPIVFLTCTRKPSGLYHLHFEPPAYPDKTVPKDAEIERLTQLHVQQLEAAIREHPEQYFWFHRRWKTQPKRAK